MAVRFLVDNYITATSMLSVDSERDGQVGAAYKVGTGSAYLTTGGAYTGANPEIYIVQIDSVAGGNEIGQATFEWWKSSTGAGGAAGITTSVDPITLENGVTVCWVAGGGDDFINGDYWTIAVYKPFGKANLLDVDRDTEWRSADLVNNVIRFTIDLGSARAVNAVALLDTNLRVTSEVNIYGAAALVDLWTGLVGSTPSGYGLEPYGEDPYGGTPGSGMSLFGLTSGVHYPTGSPTYRYWGVEIDDVAHPDGYIRAAELYVGSYTEFSRGYNYGVTRSRNAAVYGPSGALRTPRGIWASAELLDLQYHLMTDIDRTEALALFDHIYNTDHGFVRPIIINPDNTNGSDASLYELDDPLLPVSSPLVGRHDWSLRLRQRPRIARSGV